MFDGVLTLKPHYKIWVPYYCKVACTVKEGKIVSAKLLKRKGIGYDPAGTYDGYKWVVIAEWTSE